MTPRKFIPHGDRILVEPAERPADPTARIVVPENVKQPPVEGIVRALGSGIGADGKASPYEVKVGDRVLFSQYGGTVIRSEPNDYKLLNREDILAVLEDACPDPNYPA